MLGAYRRAARSAIVRNLAFCFETFPVLASAAAQLAGSMSGGEQQMLTLARALMTAPKILLIDEPSVGLAPILVIHTIDKIRELKDRYRLTVLMAEQNFHQAIRIADRGYVIVHGRIEYEGARATSSPTTSLSASCTWGCKALVDRAAARAGAGQGIGLSEASPSATRPKVAARGSHSIETMGDRGLRPRQRRHRQRFSLTGDHRCGALFLRRLGCWKIEFDGDCRRGP